MPPRNMWLTGAAPTYQPFPLPPEQLVIPRPVTDGVYTYSSTGFTIMSYRPKRPSELLAAITQQHEEPEFYSNGEKKRGGPGKMKGEKFFQAPLTWYGIEYAEDDKAPQLEAQLWEAMSARPPPTLPEVIFEIEAEMRQRWLNATQVERAHVVDALVQRGYTAHTSDVIAELTGATTLTEEFFDNPEAFFSTHFPVDVSPQHVIVMMNVDINEEIHIYEWACDVYILKVENVENGRGRGRDRGRFFDFVIGKDASAVRVKVADIRMESIVGGVSRRFRPY